MLALPVRRFTLLDGLVLTAAVAVGLAWLRGEPNLLQLLLEARASNRGEWLFLLAFLTFPIGFCLSLAVLALNLRPPCPSRRRLTTYPGFVAVFTAVAGFLVILTLILGVLVSRPSPDTRMSEFLFGPASLEVYGLLYTPSLGLAVLVAWLSLILGRRFRRQRNWLDCLGRLLGLYWICCGSLIFLVFLSQLI
ncbi:MAG TPA: hypothetical protein VFT74_18000 [Isosphaeraceae bacterium]|nr:hypothetical protein [Isosphaeraceae bacterium]